MRRALAGATRRTRHVSGKINMEETIGGGAAVGAAVAMAEETAEEDVGGAVPAGAWFRPGVVGPLLMAVGRTKCVRLGLKASIMPRPMGAP